MASLSKRISSKMPYLEKLTQLAPEDPKWNYLYAFCLHTTKKSFQSDSDRYNISLEKAYNEFWVRFNRGSLYEDLGLLDKALVDLQRAAEFKTGSRCNTESFGSPVKTKSVPVGNHKQNDEVELALPIDLNRIHSLVSNREYQEALLRLDILLERYPNSPGLNYYYAYCLQMLEENLEIALSHYETALVKGFDAFWVRYNRGSLLFKMGMLQEAKDDLKQSLLIKPIDHREDQARIHEILREIDKMLLARSVRQSAENCRS